MGRHRERRSSQAAHRIDQGPLRNKHPALQRGPHRPAAQVFDARGGTGAFTLRPSDQILVKSKQVWRKGRERAPRELLAHGLGSKLTGRSSCTCSGISARTEAELLRRDRGVRLPKWAMTTSTTVAVIRRTCARIWIRSDA